MTDGSCHGLFQIVDPGQKGLSVQIVLRKSAVLNFYLAIVLTIEENRSFLKLGAGWARHHPLGASFEVIIRSLDLLAAVERTSDGPSLAALKVRSDGA